VRINPCHGCPLKKDCNLYVEFRQRAAGIGARSVTFRCQRVVEKIPPGTRITMSMPWMDENSGPYGEDYLKRSAMEATVLSVTDDAKFNAVMDKSELIEDDRFRFRKRKHVRAIIKFLDEPPATICKNGNVVMLNGTVCDTRESDGCLCAYEKNLEDELNAARAEAQGGRT